MDEWKKEGTECGFANWDWNVTSDNFKLQMNSYVQNKYTIHSETLVLKYMGGINIPVCNKPS